MFQIEIGFISTRAMLKDCLFLLPTRIVSVQTQKKKTKNSPYSFDFVGVVDTAGSPISNCFNSR